MDNLRTLGIAAPDLKFENVTLVSDINLREFDIIVFQPCSVFMGKDDVLDRTVAIVERKLIQLADWVKLGNTIIVVLSRVPSVSYRLNNSGRNPLKYLDLLAGPLFAQSLFVVVSGSRIEYAGGPGAKDFFENLNGTLKYEYVIRHPTIEPLLRVSGANTNADAQVVSGYFGLGKGRVVLVPPIDADPSSSAQGDYLNSLPGLLSCLESQAQDLPDWIDRWQTASERAKRAEIQSGRLQIERLHADITKHEFEIAKDRWLFNLFAETGDIFADAVKKAFLELGFDVIEGPHPRADLLIRLDTQVGVIEAKGLEGSAKETNLKQAERWGAEVNHTRVASSDERKRDADLRRYAERLQALKVPLDIESESDTKGIMVIGTFRKTPLDKRTEPDFPDQLLRPLRRSSICALTGLQLFSMVMAARRDVSLKQRFAASILSANGPYSFDAEQIAWTEYLNDAQMAQNNE
jgi:hypothetical protein